MKCGEAAVDTGMKGGKASAPLQEGGEILNDRAGKQQRSVFGKKQEDFSVQ